MNKKSLILYLIIIAVLILRVLGINHGLPYNNRIFYETEEPYTIKTAMAFGTGDLNPHIFNKPSLFYYFLFFFYAIFFLMGKLFGYFNSAVDFAVYYFNNLSPFYLIARVIVALLGTACVYIIYLIGRRVYGYKTGIISALFLAVCGVHISYSRYAQVDIPQVFLVLLSIYFAIKINDKDNVFNYICAGFLAGMAASTKYYGGFCLVVPILLHFLNKRPVNRKLLYLIIFSILGFIVFTPFAILDFKTFLKHLYFTRFVSQDTSTMSEPAPFWAIEYIKILFKIANLGIPLTILSLCGILYSIFKHSKSDIALLGFILLNYGYFSLLKIGWSSINYILPIIPLFILLGTRLLVDIVSLWPRPKFLLSAVIFLFVFQPIIYNIQNGYLLSHKSTTNLAKEWIEENIPPQSRILMDILHVPQLTLTKAALEKFKNYWRLYNNRTAESLRDALNVGVDKRNRLAELKDRSITENGIPYDIYFIDYSNFQSISDYAKKYGVKYVILSSEVADIYNGPFRSARRRQANYFYDSVRKEAILLKEFRPNNTNLPGTRLEIYEIPKNKN